MLRCTFCDWTCMTGRPGFVDMGKKPLDGGE